MRYFAGFIGGFVVAVLLLVFQESLIGAEREIVLDPPPPITLATPMVAKPPETKPYERKEPPPEPEPPVKPVTPVETITPEPVRPTPLQTLNIDGVFGPGKGPYVEWSGDAPVFDGPAGVKSMLAPQYPPAALRDGVEGEVEVEFTIQPDGRVTDVRILRAEPPGVFEQSARRAIERWEFMPRREHGVAVATRARQVIAFELPRE